jgi:putative peptidoglycan lipid II flippase
VSDAEGTPTVASAEPEEGAPGSGEAPHGGGRIARSTAFFSLATGLSRIAGLVREIVAASYFGVSGAMSAFTIAFQIPNLMRALFADQALQGAFVPVFTELLEKGQKREAFRVASALFFLICLILGAFTALFILVAPVVMPLFTPGFSDHLTDLTVALSRILFPIVLLLALSGLVVGILNSFEHFATPALAPLAWNVVIIAALVGLVPVFPSDDEIYAYAIGVLLGTIVQLLLPVPWLRGRGGRFYMYLGWDNPHVRRVLKLMLPVTFALGLINFSLLVNSFFGTLVPHHGDQAPAAIDKAFRLYQLPQGLVSISLATVLFPTLSRFAARHATDDLRRTMANGVRQIFLLLIPSAVILGVLAVPITRLVYQRGAFGLEGTDLVSTALVWWSISLPFQGVSLLLTRTFFSIQRPWVTTALSAANLVVNAIVALALYEPFGIAGIVIGTVAGTLVMTLLQFWLLRPELRGVEGSKTVMSVLKMLAASALLGGVAYAGWYALDQALGRSLGAQIASVGVAIAVGLGAYAGAVLLMRIPEAHQIRRLIVGTFRRG